MINVNPVKRQSHAMSQNQNDRAQPRHTCQEDFLLAAHAQRAAELQQQMTLLTLRSLVRDIEDEIADAQRQH